MKVSLVCIEAIFEPTMQMFSRNNWKLAHFLLELLKPVDFVWFGFESRRTNVNTKIWNQKQGKYFPLHLHTKRIWKIIKSTTFLWQSLDLMHLCKFWCADFSFQYCSLNNTNNECKLLGLFSNKAFWKENDMMINCPCLACSPWQTDTQQTCSATQTWYAYYPQNVSCFLLIHLKELTWTWPQTSNIVHFFCME